MATETGYIQFAEGSAPSTPASTKWRVYFKTDGLYYIDDAGTEVGPLAAAAGGGGNPVVYDIERRSAGDITVSSTTAGNALGTIGNLVVAAASGDLLMIGVSLRTTDSDAGSVRLDVATIVSAAVVNYISSQSGTVASTGISGWFIDTATAHGICGEVPYVAQAGDISGGNVTLSLRCWVSSGTHDISAQTAAPLIFWVRNLGQ
jgi:hypothetical protein